MSPFVARLARTVLLSALASAVWVPSAAAACDPDGTQASGAKYRICMPPAGSWNGDLVIWAHGYVAFNQPVAIPEDQLNLPDGTPLPTLVNALGYAFATTSYSVNGLAVKQGLADVVDLVSLFKSLKGPVDKVYVVGASEGGLITTLAVEQRPDLFAGGLAACGPIGSFPLQINYIGDVRILFDYYYPGLLPPSAIAIPPALIDNFETHYANVIRPVIFAPANLVTTYRLILGAGLPTDPANFWPSAETSIKDALWYNVFGNNDVNAKLGGQPFDNMTRLYYGSPDDLLLNASVPRYLSDPVANSEMYHHYETTGYLDRPLVTLHTTLDQQVSWWHEWLYFAKVLTGGSLQHFVHLPVNRYGHCNFTAAEVVTGFAVLVYKAEGLALTNVGAALPGPGSRKEFDRLAAEHKLPRPKR